MKTRVWGGDAWGTATRTTLQDWPAQLAAASRPPTPRGLCTSQDAAGLSALARKKSSLPGMASFLCGVLSPSKNWAKQLVRTSVPWGSPASYKRESRFEQMLNKSTGNIYPNNLTCWHHTWICHFQELHVPPFRLSFTHLLIDLINVIKCTLCVSTLLGARHKRRSYSLHWGWCEGQ